MRLLLRKTMSTHTALRSRFSHQLATRTFSIPKTHISKATYSISTLSHRRRAEVEWVWSSQIASTNLSAVCIISRLIDYSKVAIGSRPSRSCCLAGESGADAVPELESGRPKSRDTRSTTYCTHPEQQRLVAPAGCSHATAKKHGSTVNYHWI